MAKITLHRRGGSEERYMPSRAFARAFFPSFLADLPSSVDDDDDGDNVDTDGGVECARIGIAEASGGDGSGRKKRRRTEASPASGAAREGPPPFDETAPGRGGAPSSSSSGAPPLSALFLPSDEPKDDIHIPPSLSASEALGALFLYVSERNLRDRADLSVINNDAALGRLFGCERMLFSAVRERLFARGLLKPAAVAARGGGGKGGDAPIVMTYVMTEDGATRESTVAEAAARSRLSSAAGGGDVRSGAAAAPPPPSEAAGADQPPKRGRDRLFKEATALAAARDGDVGGRGAGGGSPPPPSSSSAAAAGGRGRGNCRRPPPHLLSCDVDVPVPGLYHDRARELLRRVKRREFEYTSSRSRAVKALTSAGNEEERARARVEEAATGRGMTSGHVPALLALARAAPAGSEAGNTAIADVRIASLLEALERRVRTARACWDVVEACRRDGEDFGGKR